MKEHKKILLTESEMPKAWYNIMADMPNKPLPPLNPATREPLGPADLAPLFPMELIKQEVSEERYIEIPEAVQEVYKTYRPSPLFRATNFEKLLNTPAKIYYKYEGGSPSGSHKPNTAIPQAYYNKMEGVKRITTETGAGQWGSALSFACNYFGIDLDVYMVKISYEQKPYRKIMMNTYGANVYPSPSSRTEAGKKVLEADPHSTGSLGIAISEAIEMAVHDPETKYALGSVLNHVLLHQTIIGLEAEKQFEKIDRMPDVIVAPFGGGSNFAGIAFPFLRRNLQHGEKIECIAVEPAAVPKLTKGKFMYDFGDTVGMTPLLPMYTLGHEFVPASIHAGGLRYHGAGVLVSQLLKDGIIKARANHQIECFESAVAFARAEGILPAPEASHAIAEVVRQALLAKESGEEKVILFNLCGHGHFDLMAYEQYLSGKLTNYEISEEEIAASLNKLQQ
jgi:tryptophan synthase beta chain